MYSRPKIIASNKRKPNLCGGTLVRAPGLKKINAPARHQLIPRTPRILLPPPRCPPPHHHQLRTASSPRPPRRSSLGAAFLRAAPPPSGRRDSERALRSVATFQFQRVSVGMMHGMNGKWQCRLLRFMIYRISREEFLRSPIVQYYPVLYSTTSRNSYGVQYDWTDSADAGTELHPQPDHEREQRGRQQSTPPSVA